MLALENISVNYGAIEALTGVSMRVERGEVVTLIGANGAGKTTTLRTITGLLQPRQGRNQEQGNDDPSSRAKRPRRPRPFRSRLRHGDWKNCDARPIEKTRRRSENQRSLSW